MKRAGLTLNEWGTFRKAVRHAFWTGVATTAAVSAAPALAQQATTTGNNDDTTELETLEVTGSRLGRADIEGALPVATITREEIDRSGFVSVGELMRNTTFNSFGAFRAQSGSSAQGLVAVDLRGLGPERTLVLIDGRRAPKAPFAPSAQDLNAVPLAMVERIEVLRDGASAIYGSDAIGGVINIITRKNYDGASLSYQKQGTDRAGGDSENVNAVAGMTSGKGSIIFGASTFRRDIIFARDSLFNTPGASFFSNNFVLAGFVDANNDFVDDNTGNPYYGAISAGCPNADPAYYLVSNLIGGQNCAYDFNLVAADEAATGNRGGFARAQYRFTDNWRIDLAGSVTRATSFGRYAPSLNDNAIVVPATSPNNPFFNDGNAANDQDIYLYHRFAALGTRDNNTDANVYDLSGIVSGEIGSVKLTSGIRDNTYQFYELGRNYVVLPIAEQYIVNGPPVNPGDPAGYDIYNPTVNNSPAVLNAMKATITRDSIWDSREYFAEANMPLFDIGSRTSQIGIGFEYRDEFYFDKYDSLQEAGQIGGSAGNSSGTTRKVKSAYGEFLLPIMEQLEVTFSGRFEDYNDVGENFAPKVSTRYQPTQNITVRGSWGQGFRAPSLDIISALPAFSAEPVRNDAQTCAAIGGTFDTSSNRCNRSFQVNTTIISNPNLVAEESDQMSLGFAMDITNDLDFSIDYWKITIEDSIAFLSPSDLIDLLNRGLPLPSGFSITRLGTGRLDQAVAGFANQGTLDTSGVDIAANYRFDFGAFGRFETHFMGSYTLNNEVDRTGVTIDELGEPNFPEYRLSLANRWRLAGANVTLNGNHIAAQEENVPASARVPSYTTWDIQVGYELPFLGGTELAVGAINLFGREPSQNSQADGRDYDFDLYDQYGTQPYFKLTQKF